MPHHFYHCGRHQGGRGFGPFGKGFVDGGGMGGRAFGMGRKLASVDLQLLILSLLSEKPSHGYEIIKALDARSKGFYVPSPGMVYPALTYLEALRVEMRPFGVNVVTIAPGYIRTPMTAKNPYRMPFLMDADRFAAKTAEAIEHGTSFTVFPWQMGVAAALLRALPRWLYDRVFEKAPRKPRANAGH